MVAQDHEIMSTIMVLACDQNYAETQPNGPNYLTAAAYVWCAVHASHHICADNRQKFHAASFVTFVGKSHAKAL